METVNSNIQNEGTQMEPEKRKGFPWGACAAGVAILALAGTSGFLLNRVQEVERKMARSEAAYQQEIASMRDSTANAAIAMRSAVDELAKQMDAKNSQTSAQYQRSMANAQKYSDRLVKQLEEQQKAAQERLAAEIGEVKSAVDGTNEKVGGLESNLGSVQTDVNETKSTLSNALADLKSVRGDLGVQSGLIATNAKELAALRELGERNYYEFSIVKKNTPVKVGNVTLALKKADAKRNKFNVEVVADDKRVEKKDKTINEPVQFYVSGARLPYELVINEVGKDRITGYLATPKVMSARR
jgi:chromosome segregation ATPase